MPLLGLCAGQIIVDVWMGLELKVVIVLPMLMKTEFRDDLLDLD